MKTFADIKRRLTVGTTVTMIRHDWQKVPGGILGKPRKILTANTVGVEFEGGSWMHFTNAKRMVPTGDNTFKVILNPEKPEQIMEYRIEETV